MVFIALPALQRAQRNTQRKEDLSRIQATIQDWQKHNPNLAITDKYDDRFASNGFCTFYKRYLSDLKDPSTGRAYRVTSWTVPMTQPDRTRRNTTEKERGRQVCGNELARRNTV